MEKRAADIRKYILHNLQEHPVDVVRLATEHFGISRQSIARHINTLIVDGAITATGHTKARQYKLKPIVSQTFTLDVVPGLEEDIVWRQYVLPLMVGVKKNVLDICQYGFTEILNNVKDHSESKSVYIDIERNAINIEMSIDDKGVGIFNKIQNKFGLHDPRHALFELTKGKLTSEEARHTGEGIFFTSRMFDEFSILSGTLFFNRTNRTDSDWLIEVEDRVQHDGTLVTMEINPDAGQIMTDIFTKAESGQLSRDFSRTHVPVKVARYGNEQLVSRSQAKRVLARFERFKEVLLDFQGVDEVSPAFVDEIFRVFQTEHPEINILGINASPEIQQLIDRTRHAVFTPE